ncbi:hypothetical protein CP533_3528 [Ophiocordyceps camponoti-saundersi (nom. inval.)]|nr:hypothetical protein CP533_3528 [Ophiocordyceps camponoti-saundersi (nom. inval.)]
MAERKGYGCMRGYIFHSTTGECCSRDYVKVKRSKGKVIDAICTANLQSGLGRSGDKLPPYLRGVRLCNPRIKGDAHLCSGGTWHSLASFNPPEVRLKTCCRPRFTRDINNVCRPFKVDFDNGASSDRYWTARLVDGCERKGERGWCCEKKNEYRMSDGSCSSLRMIGPYPGTARELMARRRADGCVRDDD